MLLTGEVLNAYIINSTVGLLSGSYKGNCSKMRVYFSFDYDDCGNLVKPIALDVCGVDANSINKVRQFLGDFCIGVEFGFYKTVSMLFIRVELMNLIGIFRGNIVL